MEEKDKKRKTERERERESDSLRHIKKKKTKKKAVWVASGETRRERDHLLSLRSMPESTPGGCVFQTREAG